MMNGKMSEREFLKAYDAFSDAIFRHCYFRVYDREHAKDLTQETFVRAWEYAAQGNGIKNIRAFLYRVAHNLIVDAARKRGRETSLDALQEQGFDPGTSQDAAVHGRIDAARMLHVVDRLEPQYREVILLRYIDGLGPKEISQILGESPNVVPVRLHRAIKELRQIALPA